MRIGLLTGGGDAPGLNGIIESASRTLMASGRELVGICDGFDGIFEGRTRNIDLDTIRGIHSFAGTSIGTSNKSRLDGRGEEFRHRCQELGLAGLIVAGGDGTFAALSNLAEDFPVIGVPKTIDNDLSGTDLTFGYDTACSVVADAVDSLRATADAHRRIMVVETMGRTAGWIALGGGLASYADVVLIPERPFVKEELLSYVRRRKSDGARGLVVAVSESAHPAGETAKVAFRVAGSPIAERYGGISIQLAKWLESETGWEARHVILGHLQRSRSPTTTDRFLTTEMGAIAAELAVQGKWNRAVVLRAGRITTAPLSDLQGEPRRVAPDHPWVQLVQTLGFFV